MATDPLDRILRQADGPIAPSTEFGDSLRRRLLAELGDNRVDHATEEKEVPMTTMIARPVPVSGQPVARPERGWGERPVVRNRRFWAVTQAATAALLLLTIVGAVFTFADPRLLGLSGQPSPGATNELIAQGEIRSMRRDYASPYTGIGRFTIQPGRELASGPETSYGDGLLLFVVESGTIELTTDGPATVVSSGNETLTPVASGSAVTLHSGDRGMIQPGAVTRWRNTGADPAIVLNAAVGEAVEVPIEFDPRDLIKSSTITWPEWPAVFALHRLTLDPGASMPVSDLPGLMMLAVDSGSLTVPLQTRTRVFNAGDGLVVNEWKIDPNGELLNTGSEPAVVYALLGETVGTVEASPAPGA